MTPEEMDELLIRIDERVYEMKRKDLPDLKKRLTDLNGAVATNTTRSMGNSKVIGLMWKIGGGILIASTTLAGIIIARGG